MKNKKKNFVRTYVITAIAGSASAVSKIGCLRIINANTWVAVKSSKKVNFVIMTKYVFEHYCFS